MTGGAEEALRSFAAQALHYFDRPHSSIQREPIEGPVAWRGADLAGRDEWIVRLSEAGIQELEDAGRRSESEGLDLARVDRAAFPLPGLAETVRGWARELDTGRGFLLLRGLPVERWGPELSARVFWGIGQHLGRPGAQNPAGEVLGHVVDTGEEATNPNVRRYRTAGDIAYHCDLADVVGLLCLQPSASGGASRIVSSVSVYNALLDRDPTLVDRLYEPFLLDLRDEDGSGRRPHLPVPPCRYAKGCLRTFYHSDYFRSVVRHADVPPFSESQQRLMDGYEALANAAELRLDMSFQAGDIQLLSNHSVLHARTAYRDAPGTDRKRHLLRLWLSLER